MLPIDYRCGVRKSEACTNIFGTQRCLTQSLYVSCTAIRAELLFGRKISLPNVCTQGGRYDSIFRQAHMPPLLFRRYSNSVSIAFLKERRDTRPGRSFCWPGSFLGLTHVLSLY